jgi:transposase
MPKRRKYSLEFKRGAVEQAQQVGVSCAQIARELGVMVGPKRKGRKPNVE